MIGTGDKLQTYYKYGEGLFDITTRQGESTKERGEGEY